MKGLFLKDLYMSLKYFRSYFLLAAVFLAVSAFSNTNLFFIFYPCMLCGMIPANLQAYDERSGWEALCGTLPCTRAQIVSEKYLVGLTAQLILVLIPTALVQALRIILFQAISWEDYGALMFMLLIMTYVSSSISLPFVFKYGVEKGRMAQYLVIGVVCGGSVVASLYFDSIRQLSATADIPAFLLCLAAVALYAGSWFLSIRFYRERELK